jgi:hypothetical protein
MKHRDKCVKNQFQNKRLMNQEVELQFCYEHAGRTCCGPKDANAIRTKVSLLRKKASPKIHERCLQATSRAHCTLCDADVGTGKSDGSLCQNFCDEWLMACQSEFFDPYIEVSEEVPFCREDSLICSPILDVVNSSKEFCERMGFKVMSPPQSLFGMDDIQ